MSDSTTQNPATPPPNAADLIRRGESLMVEFKSDRKCLPNHELICAAVALANSDGGVVLVGVEDDGCVTGLHSRHSDFEAVARLVANRTVPQLSVRAWTETVDGKSVGEYILSRELYVRNAGKAAYTRQKGFSAIQHEQMILNYIDQHGQISRGEVMELCHLTKDQAYKSLSRMCSKTIQMLGKSSQAVYVRKTVQ